MRVEGDGGMRSGGRALRGPWLVALLILAAVGAAGGWAPAGAASPSVLRLVQWSDPHFGAPGWEPEGWHEALREGTRPGRWDAIVLTGDHCDNKCPEEEALRRTEAFLGRYAPAILGQGAPVVFCMGNNDFVGNYQTDPQALAPVLAAYRRHFGRAFYLDDLGNGVLPRRMGGISWISLNSQLFSPDNEYEGRADQVVRTLAWLKRELARVPRGGSVALLLHIPPTWDLYTRSPAWEPQALQALVELLSGTPAPVVILGGHFHRNELHALSLPDGRAVPILVGGSLSSKYGLRPNWREHTWELRGGGVPSRIVYRNRYPGAAASERAAWETPWEVREPFVARTWTGLIERLAADEPALQRYWEELWAHRPGVTRITPDERAALLGQVLVDTSGRGGPQGRAMRSSCSMALRIPSSSLGAGGYLRVPAVLP